MSVFFLGDRNHGMGMPEQQTSSRTGKSWAYTGVEELSQGLQHSFDMVSDWTSLFLLAGARGAWTWDLGRAHWFSRDRGAIPRR